jgi:protein SDA1
MEQNRRHRNQLPSNIPQLQNLIKRDPSAYREEFMQQYHHYQSLRELLFVTPAQDSPHLGEIVMFLAQVTPCYPEAMANFPVELKQLLHTHSTVLHPNVRMTLCRALILLRNKGVIEPDFVLELFFALFHCQDKALRVMLYSHILADIKRINAKHKNMKVNTTLQNFMYTMLSDSGKVAARMSLDLIIELYKKNIWRDARTVNVLATVCLSPVTKMMGIALQFFLTGEEEDGTDAESESSDESDAESQALRDIVISRQTVKSGRKRERKVARARAILKQCKKRKVPPEARFMALHLIHDPQDFADKLFQCLEKATVKFELRLMMMALISRLIGVHQLFVLNFYPFLQRYLQPHQKEVTKIMTYLAQASHDLVPPEVLEPTIKAVTNNFITERNSSDAIAMGLNAVREVCVRCPLVMSRELLADLAGYKTYRDKGVVMAARSLIQLYRNVRPELLQRKDRGQPMEIGPQRAREYGELVAEQHVPGMEVSYCGKHDETPLAVLCGPLSISFEGRPIMLRVEPP